MKHLHFLLIIFFVGELYAQTLKIPYICSFEDPSENALWELNAGADGKNCRDQWRIDNLESSEGFQSLYISCDTGKSSTFAYQPNIVLAYRKFIFAKGSYHISFDWKCMGEIYKTGLRAYLVPEEKKNLLESSSTKGYVASPQLNLCYVPFTDEETGDTTAMLLGKDYWSNVSIKYTFREEAAYYLVFLWQNSLTDSVLLPNAACIDNIQIVSSSCHKPENINYYIACDTIKLEWEGIAESYEVNWRFSGANKWYKQTNILTKNFIITNLDEGAYDIRIRGICGNDTSAYVYKTEIFCFCPEKHCINYIDLDRPGVSCQIGRASNPLKGDIVTDATGLGITGAGPIDFGPNNANSRHTVCCKKNEYDPRTKNQLATIPLGELASVRIGNWLIGAEAERITYDYYVDPNSTAILLLKYAMVLNAPGIGHGPEADSFFSLEILDENGKLLGTGNCGKAMFTPEDTLIDWNFVYGGDPNDPTTLNTKVAWKDWSSVGIDLRPYRGTNVKVRLTAQDCVQTGHYGYAYFTLGCVEATIKNRSCGIGNEMLMQAPDGFYYEWFAEDNPEKILSNKRDFPLAPDDIKTYVCRVQYLDKDNCDFELKTAVYPRIPKADFDWIWEPRECKNIVRLVNTSYVETLINDIPTSTTERCESQYWSIFNDKGECIATSENINYSLNVPDEGAKYIVKLKVGISEDACTDSIQLTIDVPPIYSHKIQYNEVGCAGKAVGFGTGNNFKYLTKSGTYVDSTYNCWGCDSVNIMTLNFRDKIETVEVHDTICFGGVYQVQDFSYYKSGTYTMRLKTQDEYQCDSTVILHLTVLPEIKFNVSGKDVQNMPNTGEIYISDVNLDSNYTYKVNGIENAPLSGLDVGEYEIVVCNSFGCCSEPQKVIIGGVCLELNLNNTAKCCADDSIISFNYEIKEGTPTIYTVYFDSLAKSAGFEDFTDSISKNSSTSEIVFKLPEKVQPNIYSAKIVFEDIICKDIEFDLFFTIEYSSSIIEQKFNNLLTLKDCNANGGYNFISYQWYKNDELIPGAVDSYYFLGENISFTEGDFYKVELVRENENISIFSCSIYPIVTVDIDNTFYTETPIIVKDKDCLQLKNFNPQENFNVFIYNSIGQQIKNIEIYSDGTILFPYNEGIYIFYLVSNQKSFTIKVIL